MADEVETHELWGGGSYIFTNVDPTVHAARGFEVPVTPGVGLHHIMTVNVERHERARARGARGHRRLDLERDEGPRPLPDVREPVRFLEYLLPILDRIAG